ncbi:putative Late nodulin [Medicago truncatula]|uniref:Nodule Cysteine-Rich (NCR) secreted peptide n=1 Tax=Medicago truncatula TaxID=3880 RepID=G7IT42_MEDTR|nr:Nodule Cysteine-Rich (NCR) secreted peptide [Medicago truncatula]RHN74360.1 putative Late nodulin [Medicago truncatula]
MAEIHNFISIMIFCLLIFIIGIKGEFYCLSIKDCPQNLCVGSPLPLQCLKFICRCESI